MIIANCITLTLTLADRPGWNSNPSRQACLKLLPQLTGMAEFLTMSKRMYVKQQACRCTWQVVPDRATISDSHCGSSTIYMPKACGRPVHFLAYSVVVPDAPRYGLLYSRPAHGRVPGRALVIMTKPPPLTLAVPKTCVAPPPGKLTHRHVARHVTSPLLKNHDHCDRHVTVIRHACHFHGTRMDRLP